MPKSYKVVLFFIVVSICELSLQAQTRTTYKDVIFNGKQARLNVATGEFIFIGSDGKDSIVNARRTKEDFSLKRLNYHTVEPGENMLIIAKQYGLTLKEIKDANNLSTTLVSVGQKLRVRNFDEEDLSNSEDIWLVSKGHTLYYISRKTSVSIETIKRLNGLKSNNLTIGQKLYLR